MPRPPRGKRGTVVCPVSQGMPFALFITSPLNASPFPNLKGAKRASHRSRAFMRGEGGEGGLNEVVPLMGPCGQTALVAAG